MNARATEEQRLYNNTTLPDLHLLQLGSQLHIKMPVLYTASVLTFQDSLAAACSDSVRAFIRGLSV